MSDSHDPLMIEEKELQQQESALIGMEAQLFEQEEALAIMERAFVKRNRTLMTLMEYVAGQERQLRERAEAMGSRAVRLVADILAERGDDGLEGMAEVGRFEDRQILLERRRELLAVRMELVDEREALYATRHEAIDNADGSVVEFEEQLLEREKEVSGALRKLILAASDLTGDPEPEADVAAPLADLAAAAASGERGPRLRRNRTAAKTRQFRITLEARLGADEPHNFFRYETDSGSDLPGLFVATPNLLKEDREVRVVIRFDGDLEVVAKGAVAWRRRPNAGEGAAGMGIELTAFENDGLSIVTRWIDTHPAMTV